MNERYENYNADEVEIDLIANDGDEYMFCDDLLVAPIASGTGDERDVYLPVSENWVDYFTGEKVESGHIKVSTKGIPVYRKI